MSNSIAQCQISSTDTNKVKCYTVEQVIKIDKAIKRLYVCDSVSKYQGNAIMKGDSILNAQDERFNSVTQLSNLYQKERDKSRNKLKWTFRSIPVVLGGGILLGILITN